MLQMCFKLLISLLEHDNLRKTMPRCFQAVYRVKVVAIIDCYEFIFSKYHLLMKTASPLECSLNLRIAFVPMFKQVAQENGGFLHSYGDG